MNVIAIIALALASRAQAQTEQKVVDIPTRPHVTQRMIVLSPPDPKAVVVLLAGGNGGLRLSPDGSMEWGKGNFLIRTRQLFADQGFMVVVVDAPSDRQSPPYLDGFRDSRQHVADLKAVIAWARENAKVPVWLVGTSRGTQSAAYVATELSGTDGPDGIVLTSTILNGRGGPPVPDMPLKKIRVPVLVVHHRQDACGSTPFSQVPALMAKLVNAPRKQLLAFTGGKSEGDPCEAFAHHGYNGLENQVVPQIAEWVRSNATGHPVAPSLTQDEQKISQLWTAYLESKHGMFAGNAGTPSAQWLASEQARWPMYDLAGFYLPNNSVARVVSIRPAAPGNSSDYEIVTRFLNHGSPPDSASSLVLTMTVNAVLDHGEWKLANALPQKTAAWQHHTAGQITYFIEPGLTFDSAKAGRAAAFVDSLSAAFSLPRPAPLDYYVTSSVDAALSILGLEFPEKYGPSGAFSKPVNHQVFNGIPAVGEEHRHELTHAVLFPLYQNEPITILGTEGVATWLGGTEGADFHRAARNLAAYLAANPKVTLDSIIDGAAVPQAVRYTSGAVLCAMIADVGGVPAIKEFLVSGPGPAELRAALVRLLGQPWPEISSNWRAAVDRLASA